MKLEKLALFLFILVLLATPCFSKLTNEVGCESHGYKWFSESDYPGTYSFTDDVVGSQPSGWSVDEEYGFVEVISGLEGHSKVLRIYKEEGSGNNVLTDDFGGSSFSSSQSIEWWWYIDDITEGSQVRFYDSSNNMGVRFIFDNSFKYHNNTDYVTVSSGEEKKWYHHRVMINPQKDVFDWYIDGVQQVKKGSMDSITNLDSIMLMTWQPSSSDFNVYFDAVGYSWDSSYNIGDNKIGGCCGDDVVDLRSGLISEWHLDEGTGTTANDSIGGNDGSINGAAWASGKYGQALSFDGMDDYVGGIDLNPGIDDVISVSAWVKPGSFSSSDFQGIVTEKYDPNSADVLFELFYDGSVDKYAAGFYDGSWHKVFDSTTDTETGVWKHLTATYDGSSLNLYKNRELVATTSDSSGLPSGDLDWEIGRRHDKYASTSSYFNGLIDEVRVYDRALSGREVAYLYDTSAYKYFNYSDSFSSSYSGYCQEGVYYPDLDDSSDWCEKEGNTYLRKNWDDYNFKYRKNFTIVEESGTSLEDYQVSINPNTYSTNGLVASYHFSESSSGVKDYSGSNNYGTLYGDTVGLWHFDEDRGSTVYDASAYGNDGSFGNDPAWTSGISGKALEFDGGNDYVSVPDSSSVSVTDAVTLSAWIKGDDWANPSNSPIIDKYYDGSYRDFYFWVGTDDQLQFGIAKSDGSGMISDGTTGVFTLDTDKWYHVAATWDKNGDGRLRFYANGELVHTSSVSQTTSSYDNSQPVRIGMDYNGDDNFDGTIDEVAIYDRALSTDEIESLYLSQKAEFIEYKPGYESKGRGLEFDGVDDYVGISDSSSQDITNEITLSAWVNPDSYVVGGSGGGGFLITKPGAYYMEMEESTGVIRSYFYGLSSEGYHSGNNAIPLSEWSHVSVTYNGSQIVMYLNGEVDKVITGLSGSIDASSSSLELGGHSTESYCFNGIIDEVRVYDRALTQSGISKLYHESKGRLDYADVRFFNASGEELSYYHEFDDKFWVKVPSLPADSSENVTMIYGSEEATSKSCGECVFEYFEGFEDQNLGDWETDGASISITSSNNYVQDGSYGLRVYSGSGSEDAHYSRHFTLPQGRLVHWSKVTSVDTARMELNEGDWGTNVFDSFTYESNGEFGTDHTARGTPYNINKWYKWEVIWNESSGTFDTWAYEKDGSLAFSYMDTPFDIDTSNGFEFGAHRIDDEIYVDNIYMTKYTNPEPTVFSRSDYPATYDFYDDAVGSQPSGWSVSEDTGSIEVVADYKGHSKVLKYYGSGSDEMVDDSLSDVKGSVEFWFNVKTTSSSAYRFMLYFYDDAGNWLWRWQFNSDTGSMNIRPKTVADGAFTLFTFEKDTWYHARIEYDMENDICKGYIDGKYEGSWNPNDGSEVGKIKMYNYDDAPLLYFDAIGYSSDPNYEVGDNRRTNGKGVYGVDKGLVSYYNFNQDADEDTPRDVKGKNDGRLYGSTVGLWHFDGVDFGSGGDGVLSVGSSGTVVNSYSYLTGDEKDNDDEITVNDASGFNPGDEVMVIQMQGGGDSCSVGVYEFRTIMSISGSTLTLDGSLNNDYCYNNPITNDPDAGTNPSAGDHVSSVAQVVSVPHYTDLYVAGGASITAPRWNGVKGGIVALRASGEVKIDGSIDVKGRGFRGGAVFNPGNHDDGGQGEGINGWGIQGSTDVCDGRYAANSNGGGGDATVGNNGGDGAAGGGHATGGGDGVDDNTACDGNIPLGGGTVGSTSTKKLLLGGGGGGGSDSDDADCDQSLFNGLDSGYYCQRGGHGGGIVFVSANEIDSVNVDASGHSTDPVYDGGPGGGAGGAVFVKGNIISSSSVDVSGGPSVCDQKSGGADCGGAGGSGRSWVLEATDVRDATSYNNDGRLVSNPSFTSGISGTALEFDGGNDDGVKIDSVVLPAGLDKVTISGWVYIIENSGNSWERFIDVQDGSGGSQLTLFWDDNSDYYGFRALGGDAWVEGANPEMNEWHHWTGVLDAAASEAKFYLDGKLKATDSFSGTTADSVVEIGGKYNTVGDETSAKIDEVAIYNKALSSDEVSYLYNSQRAKFMEYGEGHEGIKKGMEFDGVDDYVVVEDNDALDIVGDGTWTGWVKADLPLSERGSLIFKHYDNEYEVILSTNGVVSVYHGNNSWEEINEPSEAVVDDNKWTHFAIVRDISNMSYKWYINGGYRGSDSFNTVPVASSNPVYFGSRATSGKFFNGSIDEVRIYDRALSQEEIIELYNGTKLNYGCCGDDFTKDNFYNGSIGTTTNFCHKGFHTQVEIDNNNTICDHYLTWFEQPIYGSYYPACCGDDYISDNFYSNGYYCRDGEVKKESLEEDNGEKLLCESQGYNWLEDSNYPGTYSFTDEVALNGTDISLLDSVNTAVGSAEIINKYKGHRNVMNITAEGSNPNPEDRNLNQVSGTVEFYLTGVGSRWRLRAIGEHLVYIYTSTYGDGSSVYLYYGDGSGGTTHVNVDTDGWAHYKVEFDCYTDTFSAWVDGELVVDDENFVEDKITDTVDIIQYGAAPGYSVYYDAIGYSWDPNYNIGDNTMGGCCGDDVVNLREGLVSEWHLDEGTGSTASDNVGSNDGSINGASWASGKYGQSLSFDGSDDYVGFGDLNQESFGSICLWFDSDDLSDTSYGHALITKRDDGTETQGEFDLMLDQGVLKMDLYSDNGNRVIVDSGTNYADGSWHHVCTTTTGENLNIYVDGELKDSVGTYDGSTYFGGEGNNLILGRGYNSGVMEYIDGRIDELRIYEPALSAREVNYLYDTNVYKYFNYADTFHNETHYCYANDFYTSLDESEEFCNSEGFTYLNKDWWNTAFQQRKNFTITEESDTTLEDYQIQINPNTYSTRGLVASYHFSDSTSGVKDYSGSNNYGTLYGSTVGLWSFDENTGSTVYDATGYGNDGSFGNDPAWTSDAISGTALEFDGGDDYIDVGNSGSLDLNTEFSISAWVKFDDFDDSYSIVSKGYDGSTVQYNLRYYQNEFCFTTWDGSNNMGSCTNADWSPNTWYFLVGTYDGSWHTWVNGEEDSNELFDITASPNTNNRNTYIGAFDNNGSPGALIDGKIDEVAIYDRALSSEEVNSLYQSQQAEFIEYKSGYEGKGKGLEFDGVDDYVEVSDRDSLDITDAITLSSWVRYDYDSESYDYERLITKDDSYNMFIYKHLTRRLRLDLYSGGDYYVTISGYNEIPKDGQWFLATAVWDKTQNGGKGRLFINGEEVSGYRTREPLTSDLNVNSNSLFLDRFSNFECEMDEVRVYDRALTQSEISELYHERKGRLDYADVRFYDEENNRGLDYYHEYDDKFWVKVPELTASGTKNISMYYDNPGARSKSCGECVFNFFDDFSTNTISDYVKNNGDWFISGGKLKVTGVSGGNAVIAPKIQNIFSSYIGEVHAKILTGAPLDGSGDYWTGILGFQDSIASSNTGYVNQFGVRNSVKSVGVEKFTASHLATTSISYGFDEFHQLKGQFEAGNIKSTFDRTTSSSSTDNTYTSGYYGLRTYDASAEFDDFKIRKYASTEPTITHSQSESVFDELGSITHFYDFDNVVNGKVENQAGKGSVNLEGISVAVYNFDTETDGLITDSSGYDNHGVMVNMNYTTSWVSGVNNTGLEFDGVDDYIDTGVSVNDWSEASFNSWVYIDNYGSIDTNVLGQSDADECIMLELGTSSDNGVRFRVKDDGVWYEPSYVSQDTGEWFMFTGVYNGTHLITYINGVEQGSVPYDKDFSNIEDHIEIGRWSEYPNPNQFFNGKVDELSIYNKSLSYDEIAYLYNSSKAKFLENADGIRGLSLRLDGKNKGTFKDPIVLDKDAASLNFWAKEVDNSSIKGLFGTTRPSTYKRISFSNEPSSGSGLALETDTNGDGGCWNFNRDKSWHHYVLTFDAGTATLYRDKVNLGEPNACGWGGNPLTDDLTITNLTVPDYGDRFNGYLDDVRVYNYSLSLSEVVNLYNSSAPNYGCCGNDLIYDRFYSPWSVCINGTVCNQEVNYGTDELLGTSDDICGCDSSHYPCESDYFDGVTTGSCYNYDCVYAGIGHEFSYLVIDSVEYDKLYSNSLTHITFNVRNTGDDDLLLKNADLTGFDNYIIYYKPEVIPARNTEELIFEIETGCVESGISKSFFANFTYDNLGQRLVVNSSVEQIVTGSPLNLTQLAPSKSLDALSILTSETGKLLYHLENLGYSSVNYNMSVSEGDGVFSQIKTPKGQFRAYSISKESFQLESRESYLVNHVLNPVMSGRSGAYSVTIQDENCVYNTESVSVGYRILSPVTRGGRTIVIADETNLVVLLIGFLLTSFIVFKR